MRLRPEAGPRPHVRGQLALADRLAPRALLRLRHVLRHRRRRRGLDIGDLVAALRDDRRIRQVRAALPARRRREPQPVIRVIDKLHRGSRRARLLARPPLPPLPQRPVPRLLLIRAVRRRRLRHVDESRPARRSSSSTRAVSPAITRYASASRAASSSCGSAASSSAEGTPATSGTAGNHRHPRPPVNHRHDVSCHNTRPWRPWRGVAAFASAISAGWPRVTR